MSELINTQTDQNLFRWRLLSTVSALTLLTAIYAAGEAKAEDADRPTFWIELGGQLERASQAQDAFTAPFLEALQTPPPRPFGPLQGSAAGAMRRDIAMPDVPFDISQPLHAQGVPKNNFGEEGKLLFSPAGSDWMFSASVRYGRANGSRLEKQQTHDRASYVYKYKPGYDTPRTPYVVRFSNAQTKYEQSHLVLDFQVGKDVGLGLFGKHSQSTLGLGVRFAQFTSKSSVDIKERPQMQIYYNHLSNPGYGINKYFYNTRFQDYKLLAHSERSFHGIGPSLSWNGSAPFIGNPDTAEFAVDWGVNAALLFGRQRMKADQKDVMYDNYQTFNVGAGDLPIRYIHSNFRHYTRSRAVIVPNLGGFAGLSLKFPNAKVSLGYRADFFLGAMDAGIVERHTQDMSFRGPFATISMGLGG